MIVFFLVIEIVMCVGEICSLIWDWVYLMNRYVILNEIKNGIKWYVFLFKCVVELFEFMKGVGSY